MSSRCLVDKVKDDRDGVAVLSVEVVLVFLQDSFAFPRYPVGNFAIAVILASRVLVHDCREW